MQLVHRVCDVVRLSGVFAFGCLALTLGAGCGGERKGAQSPDPEYSDAAEYANTPSEGPGSQSSGGYYGTGSSGSPERQPAHPKPGGHQPR